MHVNPLLTRHGLSLKGWNSPLHPQAGGEDLLRVSAMGVLQPQHQRALSVEAKDQAVRQIGHDAFQLTARTGRPTTFAKDTKAKSPSCSWTVQTC